MVNRILAVCPYCSEDPGGDHDGAASSDPAGDAPARTSFIPLQSVSLLVQLLLGVFIAASVVVLVSAIPYRAALLEFAAGSPAGDLGMAEDRYDTAFLLVTFSYVATSTAFLVWFWRAYANLSFFGRTRSRRPGWAIGGWFIPIAGMVIPYGIGAEIWTQSRPEPGLVQEKRDANMEPVISWWALFLMMSLVNVVESFILPEDFDAVDLAAYVGVDIVATIVAIPAAVAAIRFVHLATRRQEELLALSKSAVS